MSPEDHLDTAPQASAPDAQAGQFTGQNYAQYGRPNSTLEEVRPTNYARYEHVQNATERSADRSGIESEEHAIGASAITAELPGPGKELGERTYIGRTALEAEAKPVITETRLEWGATLKKYRHPDREVIEIIPDQIQEDPSTKSPMAPIVFVHGIGGDDKLINELSLFAELGQRTAIGVRPADKVRGMSSKLRNVGLSEPVTEIDDIQAQELIQSLIELQLTKADLVALSRGAIRAVIAKAQLAKDPNLPQIIDTYLAHPGGQDGRSYASRHWNAARLGRSIAKLRRRGNILESPKPTIRQSIRHRRVLQKSMAKSHLNQTLVDAPFDPNTQSITIAGGVNDPSIPARDLKRNIRDTSKVNYVEVDWGGAGHGFGKDPRKTIAMISDHILGKKQKRAA